MVFADSGLEAVAAMTATPGRFAAVLMDCQMPRLDGFEATRVIRKLEPAGSRVPSSPRPARTPTVRESCAWPPGWTTSCSSPSISSCSGRSLLGGSMASSPTRCPRCLGPLPRPVGPEPHPRCCRTSRPVRVHSSKACRESFFSRLPADLAGIETAIRAGRPPMPVDRRPRLEGERPEPRCRRGRPAVPAPGGGGRAPGHRRGDRAGQRSRATARPHPNGPGRRLAQSSRSICGNWRSTARRCGATAGWRYLPASAPSPRATCASAHSARQITEYTAVTRAATSTASASSPSRPADALEEALEQHRRTPHGPTARSSRGQCPRARPRRTASRRRRRRPRGGQEVAGHGVAVQPPLRSPSSGQPVPTAMPEPIGDVGQGRARERGPAAALCRHLEPVGQQSPRGPPRCVVLPGREASERAGDEQARAGAHRDLLGPHGDALVVLLDRTEHRGTRPGPATNSGERHLRLAPPVAGVVGPQQLGRLARRDGGAA